MNLLLNQKIKITGFMLICVLQMLLGSSSFAQGKAQTPEEASEQLTDIAQNLDALTDIAERIDLGRIMVLKRKVTDTKSALDKNPLTMTTIASFQDMVMTFRFSESFLKSISTKCTEPTLQSIKKNIDSIISSRGFDQVMISGFVANFLGQLNNLTVQMKGQGLSSELEAWFADELNSRLKEVLGFARANGDVPETFKKANEIYSLVMSKYSTFEKINSRSKAYDMLTELMGLMEMYKEMATRGARNNQG